MESLTIKLDKSLASNMNKVMKHNYSTKTEFVREAIRDKIKELEKKELIDHFRKHLGFAKKDKFTTDKELEEIREKVAKKIFKEIK